MNSRDLFAFRPRSLVRTALFGILALASFATAPRAAEEIWAVTVNNSLVNFLSTNPWFFSSRPITGMQPGEQALAIDFRPALPLGRLYVLGSTSRLYVIADPSSGVASPVGAGPFMPSLSGTSFGMDFNPVVDRVRVISDVKQNLRVHPDLGTVAATDLALTYAVGDANAGAEPMVGGGAYINNMPGATSTTLYDIDATLDVLVTQAPPNNGTLNTVGPLGVNVSSLGGFDVSGITGIAYASFDLGGTQSVLYTINLATGTATIAGTGTIGCAELVRGLSVSPFAPTPVAPTTWGSIKGLYR